MSRQLSWQQRQSAAGQCVRHKGVSRAVITIEQDGVQVDRKVSTSCWPCLAYHRDYHRTVYPLKRKGA